MAPFRKRARACAGCNRHMRVIPLGADAGVDVCDECGGVFLDFFDGEPTELARELDSHARRFADISTGQPKGNCPDCEIALTATPYLKDGPWIARCGRCLGVFVTASQIVALANYRQLVAAPEPDWFGRVVRAIGSLIG